MNNDRSTKRVVSMAVTITMALAMIVSAFAMVSYVPEIVTGTEVGNEQIDAAPPSTMIRLKNANFDTAMGNPELPSTLGITSYPDHIRGTYIVQKEGPITEEWKAEITRAGGDILGYVPDNALLVRMENSVKDNVKSVRGNQWMGIYQPAYKISHGLQGRQGTVTVDIDVFNGGNNGPAVRFLKDNAGSIVSLVNNDEMNIIRATFDASLLGDLASMPDVSWLSEYEQPKYVNDATTILSQSGAGGTTRPIFDQGIHGEGQIATISDSGLAEGLGLTDVDHANFNGNVYGASGTGPKVLNYYVPVGSDGALGDESDASYHGSHCAGTVLGDGGTFGTYDTTTVDGHGYMSQLIFLDIGREDDPATEAIESDYVYPPPDYYNILYGEPYTAGARVSSNSWGGGYGYASEAAASDKFVWDNQDMVICFAAGNDGQPSSIGSQAESKNMLTVGASSGGTSMATFSSEGPAGDGRIKPDILQAGVNIDSVNGGGGSQLMSGTSMATPGTAGTSLLVRQYYEEGWYPMGTKVAANGFNPSTALVKATLINGGVDIRGSRPDFVQGWGQIHLDNSLYFSGDPLKSFVHDNDQGVVTGDYIDFTLGVLAGTPLTITLAYTDYPGNPMASKMLVNDLGLLVMGPGGTQWRGNNFVNGFSQPTSTSDIHDDLNNVEGVKLSAPTAGAYVIRVLGENIVYGPQKFALVVSGALTDGYGKVFMDRTVYDDADTITVDVEDTNNAAPSISVVLTTSITGDSETITIPWTATQSGLYKGGTISTGIGTTVSEDGILQVAHGDTITASYTDGSPAFTATTVSWVDFHGPVISNVFVTSITGTTGVPTWDTDENSNSVVYYREYGAPAWTQVTDVNLMINHLVALKNLQPDTKHEFYVESTDWRGRTTTDDRGGLYYTFRTTSAASGGALILLVDDDIGSVSDLDGSPFELDWMNNLDYYGWTYTHWDMNILGSPETADLNQAPMIIWTVSEGYPQLGVDDRAALTGYLDQQYVMGTVPPMAYIVGQDIGWDMGPEGTDVDVQWLADYLAAIYNQDDADGGGGDEGGGNPPNRGIDPMLVADIGHAVNSVYGFTLMDLEQDVYGAQRFWPDSLDATTNIGGNMGVPSWDYDTSQVAGDCAAIAQTNGGLAGTARIQFEGFAHDMLDSTGAGGNWGPALATPIIDPLRAGVLDESIQWLLGGDHPTIDLTDPIGGEVIIAANSYTISWSVSGASAVDVYYSPNSGQEYIKLNGAALPGTQTSYTWDISTLEDSTNYRVKVVALGSAIYTDLSDYSASTDFTIDHNVDNTPPITVPGSVNVDVNPISAGLPLTLTATIDDSQTGMSNIQAAEWVRGDPPVWPSGNAMAAADGAFDGMTEGVTVVIPGTETATWTAASWHKIWVRGQDTAGNWAGSYEVDVYVSGEAAPAVTYDIDTSNYTAGSWAFVSFPIDISGDINVLLNDAGTTWDVAKWYDALTQEWKTYRAGYVSEFTTINNHMGVWLHLTANDNALTVTTDGNYPASETIPLYAGWNLVGCPLQTTTTASATLPAEADIVGIWQATSPFVNEITNLNSVDLYHGHAYWVHVTADTTWTPTN